MTPRMLISPLATAASIAPSPALDRVFTPPTRSITAAAASTTATPAPQTITTMAAHALIKQAFLVSPLVVYVDSIGLGAGGAIVTNAHVVSGVDTVLW